MMRKREKLQEEKNGKWSTDEMHMNGNVNYVKLVFVMET